MKSNLFRLLSVAAALAGVPAFAHHSFAAEYAGDQPVTIKGTLTKLEWVNPHGWIYVDVKGADGKVVNWAVEFGAPNTLLRKGLRKTDFPIGSEVTVKGYRAKSGSPTVNGSSVLLQDGRNLYLGSSNPNEAGQ
ncbi:MAG: DUF6152 family protein [Bryobacteraceae bacterium]